MQVQRIQNNNPDFNARVFFIDKYNLMSASTKENFAKKCKELGKNTDEIYLTLEKGTKKAGELEKDILKGSIFQEARKTTFTEESTVWANREYSTPRNLERIYKDIILPAFNKL